MSSLHLGAWYPDWAWGLSLIVVTVVIHVSGLAFIQSTADRAGSTIPGRRYRRLRFAAVMGAVGWLAALLHGIDALVWAVACRLLEALPTNKEAMLYSLSALTTYGHAGIYLAPGWQLLGAFEALNGIMLFGLTTASMFQVMQKLAARE
jgi:hypothetical protein